MAYREWLVSYQAFLKSYGQYLEMVEQLEGGKPCRRNRSLSSGHSLQKRVAESCR